MTFKTVLVFVLMEAICLASSKSPNCGLNEEHGDPCSRPDIPCYCDAQRQADEERRIHTPCSGCVCKKGFRRTAFGECVDDKSCRKCREEPFADFRSCGSACPLVCGEPIPELCPALCVQACFCIDGYIRSSKINGTCVPIKDCPPVCSDQSMIFSQRTSCNPPSCNDERPSVCCQPGCECPPDMFLQNGTCIQDCP